MPIDFPTGPTTGQVYTYQGRSWVYNGTAWDAPHQNNFMNSPTFTGKVTGSPADGTSTTSATGLGYIGIPQSSTAGTTGAYTITAADAGESIYASATRTITIPSNTSVPLAVGTTIVFIAGAGATITIEIVADTLLMAGSGSGGTGTPRYLAPHGIATAIKTTPILWYISGNGLS